MLLNKNKEFIMKKIFSLSRYGGAVLGLLMIVAFFSTIELNAQFATKPQAPLLSLTGEQDGYDEAVYPDGRLWIPPSTSKTREILVPVFIKNNFFTFNPEEYIVPPIYSFKFSVFYDAAALQAVGVQQTHPDYMEDFLALNGTIDEDPPFAYGWNISWYDKPDLDYWKYIDPDTWAQLKDAPGSQIKRGRRMTIVGTSTVPLRTNDRMTTNYWGVLLYLKFKVIGKLNIGDPNTTYLQTPMYIAPDEIMYNDLDVTKEPPYKGFTGIFKNPLSDYAGMPAYPGVSGLNNKDVLQEDLFLKEPYKPGSIMVRISNGEPEFDFPSDVNEGYTIKKINDAEYELEQVITIDSGNAAKAVQKILVTNAVERSRLSYITIETNEPWLYTATERDQNPRRFRFVKYIDNDILGTLRDPMGDPTVDDGPFYLNIVCDPSKLNLKDQTDAEKTGIYYGYITFRSPYAKVENVRLKVKFIFIRPPYEPRGPLNSEGTRGGIYLTIRNSRGVTGDSKILVFGTGHRATAGVDSLYGEYHPSTGLSTTFFDARFFPHPDVYPDRAKQFPNGFGDFSPNSRTPYAASRDIRNYNYNGTHIFYVKFNAGGDANYPVVLTWDTRQFPEGARVFLRDTENGQKFPAVDMRKSTPVDGEGFIQSFTFKDATIKDFIIEYALPKQIQFVDHQDNPIIKKGWNLLSLPVRPVNASWNTFYPKAINIPFFFSQNQYQPESILRPGVGYFVKYGDDVDRFFSGTQILSIEAPYDLVRVHPGDRSDVDDPTVSGGWNAVGACSVPLNVTDISFSKYGTAPVPSPAYTLKYGVWAYRTDRGYYEVSTLLPGLGYWIKVNSTGYYRLIAPYSPVNEKSVAELPMFEKAEFLNNTIKLIVRDNAQHENGVYFTNNQNVNVNEFELPPLPPADLFDVRFNNNLYLSNSNTEIVRLQGVEYPVVFTINNPDAEYTLKDAISGEVIGTINKSNKTVVANKTIANLVKVEKVSNISDLAIVAYPNPVTTTSTLTFDVKESGKVTIKLYNEMGNEIATLVDADYNMGTYSTTLDATKLSAGAYLVKIINGSSFSVAKINVVK